MKQPEPDHPGHAPRLQVRLLGAFEVRLGIQIQGEWPSRAAQLLPSHNDEWVREERQSLATALARFAAGGVAEPSPPTRTAPASTLPVYLTQLHGAEAQIDALHEAIAAHRLLLLRGPGGVGKTRMAVEAVKPSCTRCTVAAAAVATRVQASLASVCAKRSKVAVCSWCSTTSNSWWMSAAATSPGGSATCPCCTSC